MFLLHFRKLFWGYVKIWYWQFFHCIIVILSLDLVYLAMGTFPYEVDYSEATNEFFGAVFYVHELAHFVKITRYLL